MVVGRPVTVCLQAQAGLMGIFAVWRLSVVLLITHFLLRETVYVDAVRLIQLPSKVEQVGLNGRPLIGILTQPGDGDGHLIIDNITNDSEHSNVSYIAASYVKFVESGGARVVPLVYNEPEEILKKKFAAINGILFPGGDTSLKAGSAFYEVSEKLYNWALEANDNGDYFPIYGVCLGFELLTILVSKDHDILEAFVARKMPATLNFVDEPAKGKSIFKWFSKDLAERVGVENLALENHQWGVSPEKFAAVKPLSDFFEVLTITPDENGKMYVSTAQAKKYPITGVQYHPEKNVFEWGYDTIPHSSFAVQVTQNVANFFISESRKSQHSPASKEEEEEFLIYNTNPVYSGKDGSGYFDQSYVFF